MMSPVVIISIAVCAAAVSLASAITALVESKRKRGDHDVRVIIVDDHTESYNIPSSGASKVRDVVQHEAVC